MTPTSTTNEPDATIRAWMKALLGLEDRVHHTAAGDDLGHNILRAQFFASFAALQRIGLLGPVMRAISVLPTENRPIWYYYARRDFHPIRRPAARRTRRTRTTP